MILRVIFWFLSKYHSLILIPYHLVGPAEWYSVLGPLRCWVALCKYYNMTTVRPFSIQRTSLESTHSPPDKIMRAGRKKMPLNPGCCNTEMQVCVSCCCNVWGVHSWKQHLSSDCEAYGKFWYMAAAFSAPSDPLFAGYCSCSKAGRRLLNIFLSSTVLPLCSVCLSPPPFMAGTAQDGAQASCSDFHAAAPPLPLFLQPNPPGLWMLFPFLWCLSPSLNDWCSLFGSIHFTEPGDEGPAVPWIGRNNGIRT